jgi:hypothetical protein
MSELSPKLESLLAPAEDLMRDALSRLRPPPGLLEGSLRDAFWAVEDEVLRAFSRSDEKRCDAIIAALMGAKYIACGGAIEP